MKLEKRLNNSYRKVYRNRHIVALNLKLTDKEFRLLEFLSDIADWDESHTDTFETVVFTSREIAPVLNWSFTVVSKTTNKLLEKKLLEKKGRSHYLVHQLSESKENVSLTKLNVSLPTQIVSPKKQIRSQEDRSSIVSYKDSVYQPIRTDEEYQRIIDSGQFPTMDISDMKWIDENVRA